jgi:hypothetical protein
VATGRTSEGEYQWAYGQLQEWMGRQLTLAKLADVERAERTASLVAGGGATVPAGGD